MVNRALGNSLVSLLISMSLGMMVLFSAVTGYHMIKKHYVQQKHAQQVLHTVRTTFEFLRRDLEASGYRGIRSRDPTFQLKWHMNERFGHSIPPAVLYPKDARLVFGFKAHPMCAEGREVLLIHNVPRTPNTLALDQKHPQDNIQILESTHLRKGALVLIADYLQGDVFIASDVRNNVIFHQTSTGENISGAFSKKYERKDHTEVVELQPIVYYLKKFQPTQVGYGLYRENVLLSGSAQELMRDITGFQIKYGFWDNDSKSIHYQSAREIETKTPPDWVNVISVQIKMKVLNTYTEKEEAFETELALRNTLLKP